MKALLVVLYLATGVACLYWSAITFFTGIYGVSFPWWALWVAPGALGMIAGAILTAASIQKWSEWISAIGGCILGSYFVPALYLSLGLYVNEKVPHEAGSIFPLAMGLLALISCSVGIWRLLRLSKRRND